MRDRSEVRTSRHAGCDSVVPAVRPQAYLVEAATGTPYPLTSGATTIGRKAGGQGVPGVSGVSGVSGVLGKVAIADPYLSREHAQILMHDGHCWLVDLDSANGSFVNSRPIDGPTPLSPGDTLSLGTTHLRFITTPLLMALEEDPRG